jgi:5-(carboxyamino)imidazole ribonucleotide mutase
MTTTNIKIGIVMGSDSDWKTMKDAAEICDQFGIAYEKRVVSAHRTPDDMADYGRTAADRGLHVIIAGAGGAAHLPGMLASHTLLPVIGVPVMSKSMNGLDSLLSIVQMPKGIPVATVAIDNATNAALLALRILALSDAKLMSDLTAWKEDVATVSRKKTGNLV